MLLVILLTLILYTLLNWQTKVVSIYNPTLKHYQHLQKKYSTSLSCLCSLTAIPYQDFVTIETKLHQICSSDFVSEKWIRALYLSNGSIHGVLDFRATASAQVRKNHSFDERVEVSILVRIVTNIVQIIETIDC